MRTRSKPREPWRKACPHPNHHRQLSHRRQAKNPHEKGYNQYHYYCLTCRKGYEYAIDLKTGELIPA